MRRQDQGIRTQNQGSVRGSGSEVGAQDRGSWAVSLERIPELGAPGRRGLGTRPGDRGPGSSVGPGEGPCPRGPHPPGPRPAPSPSGPPRARAHRPHGLLQQCPEPAQHDGGPARLAARLRVAVRRWRRRWPSGREAGPGPGTPPLPEAWGRSKHRAGWVVKEPWGAPWGADDCQ